MCPLCNETFTNISQVVVLRPTGDAIGEECYKKLVEPDGAPRHACTAHGLDARSRKGEGLGRERLRRERRR